MSVLPLEYKNLGKTGDRVSTIGMGTWRMGSVGNQSERLKQLESLKRGIELGINLIDTAEAYGEGKAEELVGEAIRDNRDAAFVATKVSPSNLHHDDVLEACNRSLERLGIRQIDLYQVHWPNPRIPIRETMSAMEKLVRDGKVRYIGVSNFSVEQTRQAMEALSKNELVSNQVEYSLANRTIESNVLPFCERDGITVIAYSPLGQGKIPSDLIPSTVLQRYHLTPAQVALNWVTFPKNVVAIPKSAKKEHAEENAASVSVKISGADYRIIARGSL